MSQEEEALACCAGHSEDDSVSHASKYQTEGAKVEEEKVEEVKVEEPVVVAEEQPVEEPPVQEEPQQQPVEEAPVQEEKQESVQDNLNDADGDDDANGAAAGAAVNLSRAQGVDVSCGQSNAGLDRNNGDANGNRDNNTNEANGANGAAANAAVNVSRASARSERPSARASARVSAVNQSRASERSSVKPERVSAVFVGAKDGKDKEKKGRPLTDVGARIADDPHELNFLVPLPEKIEFQAIPKINDAKSVWNIGMRKLEETFAEHIANMHLDFEEKAQKFEYIQWQLEQNLRFLEKFYIDMQNRLNEKHGKIQQEKDEWEIEKEEIKAVVKIDSEVVSLNVGGKLHIQTEKDVLRSVPQSLLAKMFSDMHELKKIDDEVFLDRDGRTFETLVNYLRNDRKVFPEFEEKNLENYFFKELHFWGIDSHNRDWQEQYLKRLDKSTYHYDKQLDRSYQDNSIIQNQQRTYSPTRASREMRQERGSYIPADNVTPPEYRRNRQQNSDYEQYSEVSQDCSYVDNKAEDCSYIAQQRGTAQDQECSYRQQDEQSYTVIQERQNVKIGYGTEGYGGYGQRLSMDADGEEQPGAALKAVKEKWTELGPLKLEEIIANSAESIDQQLQFGQSRYNKFIIGQIGEDGRVQGVGKEINHIIYEGQFQNDIYHGYGRYIYSNGNFYIGNWLDGKRSGWGKLVDKSGKIYEGMWQNSKFIGN